MTVFILTSGPHYEGAMITRIFDSKEKAVKAVDSLDTSLGKFEPHDRLKDFWENKLEWASISEYEVE